MQSILLTIHMTGLLLLAPNTRSGEFPLHVLMATEGSIVPPHAARLGWRESDPAECKGSDYMYVSAERICYFDMDGWAVELGKLKAGSAVLPPPGPLIITNNDHHVPLSWFGPTPVGGAIRARLSLYSGRILPGCSAFIWEVDGFPNVLLPNVVNWEMTVDGPGLTLVATSRTRPGSPKMVHMFPPTASIELFLRYEPRNASPGSPPYHATHLERLYDLLGFTNGEHRTIPDNGTRLLDECPFSIETLVPLAPGSPTCLIAAGFP
jgi:hypothetical protein